MSTATAPGSIDAVLVMAYGTPRSREEILPYYTDIRRGRPPTDELLAELTERYEAIGGLSPLAELTEAQAAGLQRALDDLAPGRHKVYLGLKHASPFIEEAVREIAAAGHRRIVCVVLAPHYSSYSIGQYVGRARTEAENFGIEVAAVESWATEPAFVEFLSRDLDEKRRALAAPVKVLFTAHSLPQRIIDSGDPYPDQLRATAEAVAARLGMAEGTDWSIAWQSAGRTPEPWIGPDIGEVIEELADDGRTGSVLVCACGFVADHLEVLYDLDIEARGWATARGLGFDRTACVNDDPVVLAALARAVVAA
jgi:ferrochelatase